MVLVYCFSLFRARPAEAVAAESVARPAVQYDAPVWECVCEGMVRECCTEACSRWQFRREEEESLAQQRERCIVRN